ncbi:hypothetical protein HanHA300_Chr04g0121601 [Helianthus annuus]|nr:hypothetical protein HanHA300_Chr04g0121601 [Helianthus annuus]KAJ0619858.1 hypothetical protein HanHA89_Chr02g0075941 [Helianthus annuus]KAJ0675286.1 hypothetical protein HanLR1_Chr12g0449481 [Helianthus annuus]KAJ0787292.1 hypothetical protein HanOQP8_Chr02g0080851 [Helianthus annuus]
MRYSTRNRNAITVSILDPFYALTHFWVQHVSTNKIHFIPSNIFDHSIHRACYLLCLGCLCMLVPTCISTLIVWLGCLCLLVSTCVSILFVMLRLFMYVIFNLNINCHVGLRYTFILLLIFKLVCSPVLFELIYAFNTCCRNINDAWNLVGLPRNAFKR